MTVPKAAATHTAVSASPAMGLELRQTMRRYVSGITVVTAIGADRNIIGLTASSFTSVSLEPPMVLVCISQSARSCRAFIEAGRIAIHMLADDQDEIARAFARRGGDRGQICSWRANGRGFAILDRYFAVLECRIVDIHAAGGHAIMVASVEALDGPSADKSPLVFHDGRMFALGAPS